VNVGGKKASHTTNLERKRQETYPQIRILEELQQRVAEVFACILVLVLVVFPLVFLVSLDLANLFFQCLRQEKEENWKL